MDISLSDAPVGRLVDGRYRIESLLARGGMATVYKATDTRLDRMVALKIMHAELAVDDDFVARFISEARSAARLSDPHIVSVFDQGEDEGAVFLAMEYIPGRTLRDVLNDYGRLEPDYALEVLESVLSALRAAHAEEIVHRDVKPENVLISDDGRVKVGDFGVARAPRGPNTTARGLLLGTVNYISPEQALGERATPSSDVYAAGIMLYELLTGRPPYTGPTDFVVVRAHIDEDVPPPSESAPVPGVVDELVATATSRSPAARYPDAGAFLEAVRLARASLASGSEAGRHASRRHSSPGLLPPPPEPDGDGVNPSGNDAASNPIDLANAFYHETPPPQPVAPSTRTRVIDVRPTDEVPASAAGEDPSVTPPGRRTRSSRRARRRNWRGPVLFAVVLLLAAAVTVGAWWFGAGRWTSTPSLLNLEPEAAVAAAEEAGLSASVHDEGFSERVEAGLVLRTDPAPGEQILRGGTIRLTISQGPERYEVPELAGMTREQVEAAVADRNLTVTFEEQHHPEVEDGRAISQDFDPGESVRPDTEITVVMSLGPEPIDITDYTGRPADEARNGLEEAGFTVDPQEQFSDDVASGLVISQDPRDGTGAEGDTITLVVSKGPEVVEVEVPDVVRERLGQAQRTLERAGFEVVVENGMPLDWFRRARVERQEPAAGSMAPEGSTVVLYLR